MHITFDPAMITIYRVILGIFFILNIGLMLILVFIERDRREATSTWAWLLLLVVLPIIGFILYLFLGRGVKMNSKYNEENKQDIDAKDRVKKQREAFKKENFDSNNDYVSRHSDLVEMLLTREASFITEDNTVDVYTDGKTLFDQMKHDLKHATQFIHLEFYTLADDHLGHEIIQILEEKAKEGLEVKILYDAIGSKDQRKHKFKQFIENGGEVESFFHAKIPFLNFRINNRNHRKILVIDGKTGYVGGFNIGDDYLGLNPKMGYWRDTHLRVQGDGIDALELSFIHDWNSQTDAKRHLKYQTKYFPDNKHHDGKVAMQLALSGPDDDWQQIEFGYLKMIMNAKESIYMHTPYFVPDAGFISALRIAVNSGVDVHLIIPNKPDQPLVHWASLGSVAPLIEEGVNVYTYENGFIHSKMMVIDGEVASVGSCNMDNRSFKLNFEVNAFVFNKEIAHKLIHAFNEDLKVSKKLTKERYESRSNWIKFKQSIAKLASPIL
ncbi:cardiolipin synthase [Staphylococcus massiliensis]|uniref:cardiolipin synthase n=1 Tax=Staphylococcus massiliensis TaxID=555791 RepID=UPI001EDF006D|nr:cardiolipin synthase [Staphylococcus massiliensis]MCG3402144.1 cardiolipin synthase [Staphylococcus massiliensis]